MYTYKFTPTEVIDGVTIDGIIDLGFSVSLNYRVRLLDVAAPDLYSKDSNERKAAHKAKQYLESVLDDYIHNMSPVIIETVRNGNRYGRILSRVFIKDINIIDEMLQKKLIIPYGHSWSN